MPYEPAAGDASLEWMDRRLWWDTGRTLITHRHLVSFGLDVTKSVEIVIISIHNEDGSYTYGYEGADGSFKIETKLATGEVKGKYGYVDENGKVKVVEYGANKYGFQPSGEGITVPPPTLIDETTGKDDLLEDDDGNIPAPRLQVCNPGVHFANTDRR
uniref:Cuticle protein 6 n=1 Tax=Anopheles maculatus TaxID=74869 RepID=A0A182TCK6_9DIPT